MQFPHNTTLAIAAAAVLFSLAGCSAAVNSSLTAGAPDASGAPLLVAKSVSSPPATATPNLPAPVQQSAGNKSPASPSPASTACAGTPAGVKHIYVSISQQHLWACTGSVLLTDAAVTTGASALTNVNDATPVGNSHITGKSRATVLSGHDVNGAWNDHVTYWMPFNGGDGFHDAPWQTFPLGSQLYKTQGSHGCVHVPLDVLGSLFNWAQVGTLVTIRA